MGGVEFVHLQNIALAQARQLPNHLQPPILRLAYLISLLVPCALVTPVSPRWFLISLAPVVFCVLGSFTLLLPINSKHVPRRRQRGTAHQGGLLDKAKCVAAIHRVLHSYLLISIRLPSKHTHTLSLRLHPAQHQPHPSPKPDQDSQPAFLPCLYRHCPLLFVQANG